jgi:hypothetical protein
MPVEMPAKEPGGGLPCEASSAGDDRVPVRWLADRAEFLGEDGAGREYWLLGGHVYMDVEGRTSKVCPLAGCGRVRKLGTVRGRVRGRTRRRTLAA